MYDDVDYRFNWVGLVIKIVIFIILILIAIAVISTTIDKNKKESNFDQNYNTFKDAVLNYFVGDNLPKEKDEKIKMSLEEMIDKKIVTELLDEKGNTCDVKKSYVEVTNLGDHYLLSTNLYCGENNKSEKINLNNNQCEEQNCPNVDNNTDIEDKEKDNETQNNNDNTKQTYYEYVKTYKEYTPWQLEKITSGNVEVVSRDVSLSKFCKIKQIDYYSSGYVGENTPGKLDYVVRLMDVPSNAYNVKILGIGYLNDDIEMYKKYLNNNNLEIENGNHYYYTNLSNPYLFRTHSLRSNNFKFSVSSPFEGKNGYYVNIKVNVNNRNGVTPYYFDKTNSYIYFTPVHFWGQYVDIDDCTIDLTDNSNKYEEYYIYNTYTKKTTIYRSYTIKNDYSDTTWSTESSLEGYVKTGKTELR